MNKCYICKEEFTNLELHFSKDHENEGKRKKHICLICDEPYSSKKSLRYHMESNHVSENFECDICSKILSNSYQLTKHIKIHSEPTHECELCQKTFNLKANLVMQVKLIFLLFQT